MNKTKFRLSESSVMSVEERFKSFCEEYIKFERVEHKLSARPDLHAFLLLDSLFPSPGFDIVSGATHDEIFLAFGGDQLDALTDEQVRDLVRCGVRYAEYGLCMFV